MPTFEPATTHWLGVMVLASAFTTVGVVAVVRNTCFAYTAVDVMSWSTNVSSPVLPVTYLIPVPPLTVSGNDHLTCALCVMHRSASAGNEIDAPSLQNSCGSVSVWAFGSP